MSASDDRTVKVWDAATGRELLTLAGHGGWVWRLAVSADGTRVATASADGTTKVWDVQTGQDLLTLRGHRQPVVGVAFSLDGHRLATASLDGTARIWDARPVPEPLVLVGHTGQVNGVAFSPDGRRLVTISADGTARVWDVHTGRELAQFTGHSDPPEFVTFSPDGRRVATGSTSHVVHVWDAVTGRQLVPVLHHHTNGIAFGPDGRRLASTGPDGTRVWDVKTGQEVAEPDPAQFQFQRDLRSALSADGSSVARIEGDVVHVVDLGQAPDADELAFRHAMARPDPAWQDEQAARYEKASQWFAAAFHLNQALTAQPDRPLHLRRGRARAELGHWAEASADFAQAVAQQPGEPDGWRGLALAQLAMKQPDESRQTCGRFLERFAHPTEAAAVWLAIPLSAYAPLGPASVAWAVSPLVAVRRLAVRTAVLQPGTPDPARLLPWAGDDPLVRGAVLCRAGRHDEAVRALGDSRDVVALLYRALAEHGRGRADAARAALTEAENGLAPHPGSEDFLTWEQRIEAEVLRAEARALLIGQRSIP